MPSPFPKFVQRFASQNPWMAETTGGLFVVLIILILGRLGIWP